MKGRTSARELEYGRYIYYLLGEGSEKERARRAAFTGEKRLPILAQRKLCNQKKFRRCRTSTEISGSSRRFEANAGIKGLVRKFREDTVVFRAGFRLMQSSLITLRILILPIEVFDEENAPRNDIWFQVSLDKAVGSRRKDGINFSSRGALHKRRCHHRPLSGVEEI